MKTFSCRAPYGAGGLGQHLAVLVEDARRRRVLAAYYTIRPKDADAAGRPVRHNAMPRLSRWTPLRYSPGLRAFLDDDFFDRSVAASIVPSDVHVGFTGQSLRTFRSLRTRGCKRFELVSPTCHVEKVRRQYERAYRDYPIERAWLNDLGYTKAIREYEAADSIVVFSDYVRDSFLEAGVSPQSLTRFHAEAAPRFTSAHSLPDDGVFRIVYTGALSVAKGVPVLLDAFARFPVAAAELTLVGGPGTRAMRRYLGRRCHEDPRVTVSPGDPLPHLQRADVYVHPSYQDGLAYAPLEALACGVPIIVTEDTGTKELVKPGVNGYVVPTGDSQSTTEAIRAIYERRIKA